MQYAETFYDILLKRFREMIEIPTITQDILKIVVAIGFILIFVILYRIYKYDYLNSVQIAAHGITTQEIKDDHHSLVRYKSIISHKDMLHKLEYAANRCYSKEYALECIDIVVYCPHLINMRTASNGCTPFHLICFHGHTCLITFMLAKGADPFITTITGENALCMAIHHFLKNPMKDDFSSLEVLRSTGCNLGLNDKWYNKFLKKAVAHNHTTLAQWLIMHFKSSFHNNLRSSSTPPSTVFH